MLPCDSEFRFSSSCQLTPHAVSPSFRCHSLGLFKPFSIHNCISSFSPHESLSFPFSLIFPALTPQFPTIPALTPQFPTTLSPLLLYLLLYLFLLKSQSSSFASQLGRARLLFLGFY